MGAPNRSPRSLNRGNDGQVPEEPRRATRNVLHQWTHGIDNLPPSPHRHIPGNRSRASHHARQNPDTTGPSLPLLQPAPTAGCRSRGQLRGTAGRRTGGSAGTSAAAAVGGEGGGAGGEGRAPCGQRDRRGRRRRRGGEGMYRTRQNEVHLPNPAIQR